jgi:hypothetical protein
LDLDTLIRFPVFDFEARHLIFLAGLPVGGSGLHFRIDAAFLKTISALRIVAKILFYEERTKKIEVKSLTRPEEG